MVKKPTKTPQTAQKQGPGRKPAPINVAGYAALKRKLGKEAADHIMDLRLDVKLNKDAAARVEKLQRDNEELHTVIADARAHAKACQEKAEEADALKARVEGLEVTLTQADIDLSRSYKRRDALETSAQAERTRAAKYQAEAEDLRKQLDAALERAALAERRNKALSGDINLLQAERRGMREMASIFAEGMGAR